MAAKEEAIALRNLLELEGAINGQVWHDTPMIYRQLEGIGPAMSKTLYDQVKTMSSLCEKKPHELELILKKNPPFGMNLMKQLKQMPYYKLDVQSFLSPKVSLVFTLRVETTRCPSQLHLVVVRRRMYQSDLSLYDTINSDGQTYRREIKVDLNADLKDIIVSVFSKDHAGLNVHRVFQIEASELPQDTFDRQPIEIPSAASPLLSVPEMIAIQGPSQVPTKRATLNESTPVRKTPHPCRHTCRDKKQCKHRCCKTDPNYFHVPVQHMDVPIKQLPPEPISHKDNAARLELHGWLNQYRSKALASDGPSEVEISLSSSSANENKSEGRTPRDILQAALRSLL